MKRVTEHQFSEYNEGMFESWDIDYYTANAVYLYSDRLDKVVVRHTGDVMSSYRLSAAVKAALIELFCDWEYSLNYLYKDSLGAYFRAKADFPLKP